ncbi:guanine nucleotide exchange factor synembryn-domain-containing protein [Fennellomyces sp. T-0311]|nr:guanine nucleotide exchange factor synembryn-domain-containing protein [Fennellomyces sp. T-0311]
MSLDQYKALRTSADTNAILDLFDTIEANATCIHYRDRSPWQQNNLFLLYSPGISAESKPAFVSTLVDDLNRLPESPWTEQVTTRAIQVLKLLGRDATGADALFSERGIKTLLKLGGLLSPNDQTDTAQTREALKCLSNCILLRENTKEWVVKHDSVAACFHLLQSSTLSTESQFLTCRILFLLTVNSPDIVQHLIRLDVPVVLQNVLVSNVAKLMANESQTAPINANSVVNEALKLLFNLMLVDIRTSNDEETVGKRFSCCLPPIYDITFNMPLVEPMPLVPPFTHAIHALMQYPYSAMSDGWYHYPKVTCHHTTPEGGREVVSHRLCDILEKALAYLIPSGDPDDLEATTVTGLNVDATLSPVLLVIRVIAMGEPGFVEYFKKHMLPSDT